MSRQTKGYVGASLVAAVVVGALVFILARPGQGVTPAFGDDANHVTTLQLSGGQADAVMTTQLQNDVSWVINFYITPSGSSEEAASSVGSSAAQGWPGGTGTGSVNVSGLSSGDAIRAEFKFFDNGGNTTFSYSRSITIP